MERVNPQSTGILFKVPSKLIGGAMQKIQYVSKYIALAEEGLATRILCPMDQGLLLCNQDLEDKIYLYCLECDYKKYIGLDLYNKIVLEVSKQK
jgi:hypothetical protein